MNEQIVMRDVIRLADAKVSIGLWERQKAGELIFKSDYDPDERIEHYTAREAKYQALVLKHVGVSPTLITIVTNILKTLFPNSIIQEILDLIL